MKLTDTFVLFQPLAFGAGEADPLIVGAVASRLMVTDWLIVPPALVAATGQGRPRSVGADGGRSATA